MKFNFKKYENKLLILFTVIFLISIGYLYYKDVISQEEIRVIPYDLTIDLISGEELLKELKSVDINTANYEEIQTLPGIGPILAKRIIEYRENYGSFLELGDLIKVKGIGRKKLERIKEFIIIK